MDRTSVRKEIQGFLDQFYAGDGVTADQVGMHDLDSFTVIQLVLHLEDVLNVVILEEMHGFEGGDFDAFADFVVATARTAAEPTTAAN
ncbi:hypothetical protein ACFVIM_34610 [Streptomyces sp. NPDC057638]|uniref:hypothetical protein n=1 Tax=Streptomyces sp. NPDC057638 TaxID=3346190 RepID=UPI0036A2847B